MNIQQLIEAAKRPEIYTPGTAVMWVDEYISTQLLETHLNPETELASRKETTIRTTVDWILNMVPGSRLNILDLGCGPGLYTEKLAEKGHRVTGMDFSANSIRYARESARKEQLDISYIRQDYLGLDEENTYDLILMIFFDFGVLPPNQRNILLKNIYRALKPGGVFLFDVLNERLSVNTSGSREWDLSEKGFWRSGPYLALSETFYYDAQNVTLKQHIVADDTGLEVYRFWEHRFSHADLVNILSMQKFRAIQCYDGVIPGCDMYRSKDVTFCISSK